MASHTSSRREKLVKGGGFVLGVALVALAVLGWRVPRGTGWAGTDLFVVAQPSGELAVSPTGPFLATRDLSPGDHAAGSYVIANQTGQALDVRLRALPDSRALDRLLRVEIRADGLLLYSGPVGGLRAWTAAKTALPVRGVAKLGFRVWYPQSMPKGWQGQVESVPIELKATRVVRLA